MEGIFFSAILKEKLARMRSASLTMIEAPAGYGKTTAVRMALREVPPEAVCWYTALDSMADSSFSWFVRQLGNVDCAAEKELRALGMLNRSNAFSAAEILLGAQCEQDRYIVIDNFQFALDGWQPQILCALARRGGGHLHVIFVSQYFGRLGVASEAGGAICHIEAHDLLLTEADVRGFAKQIGLPLTGGEAASICAQTQGWAVAVSLCLQNMLAGGGQLGFGDTNALLDQLLWSHMTPGDRELALRLCVFDKLTERQIAYVLHTKSENVGSRLPEYLARTPLMGYAPQTRQFYPHIVLLTFFRAQLERAAEPFRAEVYRTAGKWYRDSGQDREAVACFYAVRDYDGLLSCRLSGLLMERFGGASYTEVALSVLRGCPAEIKAAHPLSVLRLCYALYAGAAFRDFEVFMEEARAMIDARGDPQLQGEWQLVAAFLDFPDLTAMIGRYRRAAELMHAPSEVFTYREPFLFGSTSMWYLFYSVPGKMMETAELLHEAMRVYNSLTGGHGLGAYELYLGEAHCVRGEFAEAEILAHKAELLSEQGRNASVTYGAALLLGINAVYQSDMGALQKAIELLENKAQAYPFLQGRAINGVMVETVRGYLLALMMETARSAQWTQGEADSLGDLSFTNFMVKTVRITDLILKKEYTRAIASVEASLQLDPRLISLPTRNFMHVGLALCYLAIGRLRSAAQHLDISLTLAEKDHNFTFLASFRRYLSVLFLLPGIAERHSDAIRIIRGMKINYTRARESRIFSMLEREQDLAAELTEREHEIAALAARGMHNREIAASLNISEETVKSHLKTIFQKTNIDRRSRLIELLK